MKSWACRFDDRLIFPLCLRRRGEGCGAVTPHRWRLEGGEVPTNRRSRQKSGNTAAFSFVLSAYLAVNSVQLACWCPKGPTVDCLATPPSLRHASSRRPASAGPVTDCLVRIYGQTIAQGSSARSDLLPRHL